MQKRLLLSLTVLVAAFTGGANAQPLVDTVWLATNLDQPNLVVLDIRNRIDGGSAEVFAEGHVPGAVYSNYLEDGWRTTVDGVPGMMSPVADLETLIGGLGIGNVNHVTIVHGGVSSSDFGSAARVYWTFKVLDHDAVSILDGGYQAWSADASNPIETGPSAPVAATFVAEFQPQYLATTEEVVLAMADREVALVDARPASQFRGESKVDAARAKGTIPGARNLQQSTLVAEAGTVEAPDTIAGLLRKVGLKSDDKKIAFCNTGHWASVAWFALSEVLGNEDVKMYDGSMVAWTADAERPLKVRGADVH